MSTKTKTKTCLGCGMPCFGKRCLDCRKADEAAFGRGKACETCGFYSTAIACPQCHQTSRLVKNIKPATKPTDAMPGSPEKVRVMEERFSRSEALWHPLDARESDREREMAQRLAMLAGPSLSEEEVPC